MMARRHRRLKNQKLRIGKIKKPLTGPATPD